MREIVTTGYIDSVTGDEKVQTGTGGAAHTNQQGGVWDYGNWPHNRFVPGTVTLAASPSGTVVYEAIDITAYNGFVLEVSAIGGTTPAIKLSISLDGTNYAATLPELVNLSDNTIIPGATGISAIGLYALNIPAASKVKYRSIKLIQTGGAADQTCTIRYAHLWA